MRKVLAFDCFGTVFDHRSVPESDQKIYTGNVKRSNELAKFLGLDPPRSFYDMQAHSDARYGIDRLREKFIVVTLSNMPSRLIMHLSDRAGIRWHAIIPIEGANCYKPDVRVYQQVTTLLQVKPEDVTVISMHAKGPDVVGAPAAGMGLRLIRQHGDEDNIIQLADSLGCPIT